MRYLWVELDNSNFDRRRHLDSTKLVDIDQLSQDDVCSEVVIYEVRLIKGV